MAPVSPADMTENAPKVLLLGDSIRMSYQPAVARILAASAQVVGPAENCEYSLHTLSSLDRWIRELGRPSVVHWNNGLHDCGHNPARDPVQIPIDVYRETLIRILERLRQWRPRVIWASSTPVHPDRPFTDSEWSWRNEEIEEYNRVAAEVMTACDVPIHDLHRTVLARVNEYLSDDQLHLSEPGCEACARAVADAVSSVLAKDPEAFRRGNRP